MPCDQGDFQTAAVSAASPAKQKKTCRKTCGGILKIRPGASLLDSRHVGQTASRLSCRQAGKPAGKHVVWQASKHVSLMAGWMESLHAGRNSDIRHY